MGAGAVDVVVGGAGSHAATPPPPVLVLKLWLWATDGGHGYLSSIVPHGGAGRDGQQAMAMGGGVVDVVMCGAGCHAAMPPPPVLVLKLWLRVKGDGRGRRGAAGRDRCCCCCWSMVVVVVLVVGGSGGVVAWPAWSISKSTFGLAQTIWSGARSSSLPDRHLVPAE